MRNLILAGSCLIISMSVFSKQRFSTITLKSIDLSGRFTACAVVDVDSIPGRVACWGRNKFPMFLDGSYQKAFAPILLPAFSNEVSQVATGSDHACVLLIDGKVQCWGNNQFGQLGLGHRVSAFTPVQLEFLISTIQLAEELKESLKT